MSKPSLVVVLAEDKRQQDFLRGLRKEAGYQIRNIRFQALPAGRKSGEQHVRQRFPSEVKAARNRSARASTGLAVMIDADTRPTAMIRASLRDALMENQEPPVGPEEGIGIFVPKRHIETWVLALDGLSVDEQEDCKGRVHDHQMQPAGRKLIEQLKSVQPCPPQWIPSLKEAAPEAKRLLPA